MWGSVLKLKRYGTLKQYPFSNFILKVLKYGARRKGPSLFRSQQWNLLFLIFDSPKKNICFQADGTSLLGHENSLLQLHQVKEQCLDFSPTVCTQKASGKKWQKQSSRKFPVINTSYSNSSGVMFNQTAPPKAQSTDK